MKNIRLTFALLVSFFIAFQANADDGKVPEAEDGFAYNVQALKDQTKVIVSFKNEVDTKVTIKIYDSQHHLLIKEVESGREMAKVYDLSNVGDGHYTVALIKGDLQVEEELDLGLTHNDVAFPFTAGVFPDKNNNNKMIVGFANAPKGDVIISIEDESGDIIYTDYISSAHHYTQRFNMESLDKGIYKVVFAYKNKDYAYSYAVSK